MSVSDPENHLDVEPGKSPGPSTVRRYDEPIAGLGTPDQSVVLPPSTDSRDQNSAHTYQRQEKGSRRGMGLQAKGQVGVNRAESTRSKSSLGNPGMSEWNLVTYRERSEQFLRQGSVLWEAAAFARDHNPQLITDNLRHAGQLLRDMQATLDAGGFLQPHAGSYAGKRRTAAINALCRLDLPSLLGGAGIDAAVRRDVEAKIEFLRQFPQNWVSDTVAISDFLKALEAEVSDLLKHPDWGSPAWRGRAHLALGLIGHIIITIGTALLVAVGSLFAVGEPETGADDVKAMVACVIGMGCAMIQRYVPALRRQPNLSQYLGATDNHLRDEINKLRSTLTGCSPNNPGAITGVALSVFAVEQNAYWAQCLSQAADHWADSEGYCSVVTAILKTCYKINTEQAIGRRNEWKKLVKGIKRHEKDLDSYRIRSNLQLRQGARLTLVGRIACQAMPTSRLSPAVGLEAGDGDYHSPPGPVPRGGDRTLNNTDAETGTAAGSGHKMGRRVLPPVPSFSAPGNDQSRVTPPEVGHDTGTKAAANVSDPMTLNAELEEAPTYVEGKNTVRAPRHGLAAILDELEARERAADLNAHDDPGDATSPLNAL